VCSVFVEKPHGALHNIGHAEFSTENGKKIERIQSASFIDKIFTTNYDPIIEAFFRKMDWPYSDGFDIDEQRDLSFQDRWNKEEGYQLIKLHGSIDYYSKTSRRTVKYALNSDSPDRNIYGEKLERMMILPIGEKYVTKSPYIGMLNKLRYELDSEEVVVAIGYFI
jgi:hypothetical protein